jgi:hypothetical protein
VLDRVKALMDERKAAGKRGRATAAATGDGGGGAKAAPERRRSGGVPFLAQVLRA